MPHEIIMPQLSDTMTQGTLVKWLKKEGDKVKEGDIIAEVETDKATMEMEASASGTIAGLLVKEGEQALVGTAIAVLATGKETPEEAKKSVASRPAAKAPAAAPSAPAAPAAPDAPSAPETPAPAAAPAAPPPQPSDAGGRVKASPLARRIAAAQGVPLDKITGTGPGGRIVQRDVETFKSTASAPQAAAAAGQTQVIPMTKMRAAIAAQLLKSKQSIPHFYETIDIDVEDLSALRQMMNKALETQQVRLSLADFIVRALAITLPDHPALNARFDSTKNEVTRYGDINLGIAVAVPDGLIVPILRGINKMTLRDIRQRTADLVERARAQRLRREEQTEGTFTISNLGTYGIRDFSAIINPPEVAILAVGAAEKRAVVRDGAVVAKTMLSATLSCDHRVVDGAVAAAFMQAFKNILQNPGIMVV